MSAGPSFPSTIANWFDRWRSSSNAITTTIGALGVLYTVVVLGLGSPFNLLLLGLTGVIGVGWAAWRWPIQTALCLPALIVSPQFVKLYAYEPVLIAIGVGLAYHLWSVRSPWLRRLDKLEIAFWLLFGFMAFTIFWSPDSWWWLFGIRKVLIAGIGLWVSWRLARMVRPEFGLLGLALCGCAVSLNTLEQAWSMGWFGSSVQHTMRRTATDVGWGTANYIAAVLTILLPAAVYLALNKKVDRPFRITGWVAIPLTILVVTIAASRGGALMVLLVVLFAIFRSRLNKWHALSMGIAAILLLLLGPGADLLLERFSDPGGMASAAVRIYYFKVAWWRIEEFWPVGMGWGQGWSFTDQLRETDPHNYWLVLITDLGAMGLILWGAVLIILWHYISKMEKRPSTQGLARSFQLVFVIAQINLMFEPTFQGLQYHFLFYWICGVYLGAWDWHVAREEGIARKALAAAPG